MGAFWAGMAGTLYAAKMTTIAPALLQLHGSRLSVFAVVILAGGSQLGVLAQRFPLHRPCLSCLRGFSSARMLFFGAGHDDHDGLCVRRGSCRLRRTGTMFGGYYGIRVISARRSPPDGRKEGAS